MIRIEKFLMLIRVIFEKQVFEVQKSKKPTFEILNSLKKKHFFLKKMRSYAGEGKVEFFKLVRVRFEKQVSEVR